MRIEYSGDCSWERSAASKDHTVDSGVHSLAKKVVSQAEVFDSLLEDKATCQEPILGLDITAGGSPFAGFPTAPAARKMERLISSYENPDTAHSIRADRLREAHKTAQDLDELLARAREGEPGLTGSAAPLHAEIRQLGQVLARTEAGSLRLSDSVSDGQQHPGVFDVVERSAEGAKVVARETPRLYPATLDVASPSHGEVRISGLARFFPAHTVHARRSTAVVTGDNCELQSIDHYHVHRVSVSLDPLLRQGSPGHSALEGLLKDPSEGGVRRFQQSMQGIAGPPEQRQTQASVPVRVHHVTSVTSSEVVHEGRDSRTNLETHYMVEESKLPIIDLLARDPRLVRSLATAAGEIERGDATRAFLHDALHSAGRADDLALLKHGKGLRGHDTLLFGLFGVDMVDRASAVMVGTGNKLRTDMKIDRGRLSAGTVLDDLDHIRDQAARADINRVPEQEVGVRAPRVSRGRSAPTVPGIPRASGSAQGREHPGSAGRPSRGRW